ncbi:amidohydrolase family protein [Gayadomonas joobiniege]|uniref:amidohydrolase family protein n=1 Tax=Gayadomonas joobiniege TaxID=1234606 RepID=UPI00036FE83A|nr:amidohydrolase family protein [Gayadomonas joobiniege]
MNSDKEKVLLLNVKVPVTLYRSQSQPIELAGDDCLQGDLLLEQNQVVGFCNADELDPDGHISRINLQQNIILPKFNEVHVHLDKCHTVDRLGIVGGNLMQAIDVMQKDKQNWTVQDIHERAGRALGDLYQSGCQAVRTHVDWGDEAEPPIAWAVMHQLAIEWKNKLTLQVAALTSLELFDDAQKAEQVVAQIAKDNGVLGVFVLYQTGKRTAIKRVFELAKKYKLMLDFHVDEGLDTELNGIQLIAETAISSQFEGTILCGHVCNLINYQDARLATILAQLKQANISVATLPSTNLYLQGRTDGTPDRRGLTRVKELQAAGVSLVVGSDNVEDAFCPIGQHSPLYALSLAVLTGHLDPPLAIWLESISTRAAAALGLKPTYVSGGSIDDLLIANCTSLPSLVSGSSHIKPLAAFLSDINKDQVND